MGILKPLLVATPDAYTAAPLAPLAPEFDVVCAHTLPDLAALAPGRPTVLLVDVASAATASDPRAWLAAAARHAAVLVRGPAGRATPAADVSTATMDGWLAADADADEVAAVVRRAVRHAVALAEAHEARAAAAAEREALSELARAGIALGTERDPAALLATILDQARRISGADAGSIYLVERTTVAGEELRLLRFEHAQNHSVADLPFAKVAVPLDHASVAGHAALTGEPLVIADVYALPAGARYRINRTFDDRFGYRTRSMLVIPMKSQRDEVVGVLQLINRKRDPAARLATPADVDREVVAFDARAVEHVQALAAQAAVSIENTMLHASIERLFDGFVAAAATAVEARDPTTYGHSRRVATLAVRLAEAIDRGAGVGRYRDVRFTRDEMLALRYAALLHDFGKVAVREDVLVKEKKLHPGALERVTSRLTYLVQQAELDAERDKVAALRAALSAACSASDGERALRARDVARDARVGELREVAAAVAAANDPGANAPHHAAALERAAGVSYTDRDGVVRPLLTPAELRHLSIARGNLDDDERAEVESHVVHTFRFLEQIPWTPALAAVPAIAHTHHEKPNGRGYPRGLAGDAIPLAARIVAVADIFDALTSADRAYKAAMPLARAVDIMRREASEGGLDADLLETFVAAAVYAQPYPSGGHPAVPAAPRASEARYPAPRPPVRRPR